MGSPLVLLVSRSASRTQSYRNTLDQFGISCLAFADLKDVPALAAGTPFNGIMIDMPVLIKANANDKLAIEDILKALPSAYLNIAPASDAIRLLIATGTQGTARSLDEFAELCKAFPARVVRPKDRYPLYLQAILTSGPALATREQTVTLNVSPNGCFLFSTNQETLLEQTVSISFIGLEDTTPVSAVICWLHHWGDKGHYVPGIGVRFNSLTASQSSQIDSLLEPLKPH